VRKENANAVADNRRMKLGSSLIIRALLSNRMNKILIFVLIGGVVITGGVLFFSVIRNRIRIFLPHLCAHARTRNTSLENFVLP